MTNSGRPPRRPWSRPPRALRRPLQGLPPPWRASPQELAKSRQEPAQRAAKASAAVDKYSKALTTARASLGKTATAEDRARATSKDLTETVTRNREALAKLRVEILKTGDADGELARDQKALAVSTAGLVQELGRAKREVASYDKAAREAASGRLAKSFSAAKVAVGNLASSAVQSIGGGLVHA